MNDLIKYLRVSGCNVKDCIHPTLTCENCRKKIVEDYEKYIREKIKGESKNE